MAAGVMLAASFDLIQDGRDHGSGNWVVMGILSGGIFILLCKKFLEHYGEVSMLDIKGADETKVILVIGIMTLHSFGEGSGVGVSFVGSKGLSQGLLITLAINVHNIPEGLAVSMVLASRGVSPQNAMLWSVITSLPQPIVAVPSFICADAFNKMLSFCTGFAAGCMIWMVVAGTHFQLPLCKLLVLCSKILGSITIQKSALKFVDLLGLGTGPELEKKLKYIEDICTGVILAKELVNAPATVLTPAVPAKAETAAAEAEQQLQKAEAVQKTEAAS